MGTLGRELVAVPISPREGPLARPVALQLMGALPVHFHKAGLTHDAD